MKYSTLYKHFNTVITELKNGNGNKSLTEKSKAHIRYGLSTMSDDCLLEVAREILRKERPVRDFLVEAIEDVLIEDLSHNNMMEVCHG